LYFFLQNSFSKEQQTLKDLVDFARTSMDEMQTKINYYKEKSDSIEKLERDLNEVWEKFFLSFIC